MSTARIESKETFVLILEQWPRTRALSRSLVQCSARIIHSGNPPSERDDSLYILQGKRGAPDVCIWPGLLIERQWRVREEELDHLVRIECSDLLPQVPA